MLKIGLLVEAFEKDVQSGDLNITLVSFYDKFAKNIFFQ